MRARSVVIALAAAALPLAACTWLIDFVDQPNADVCDGASCIDARTSADVVAPISDANADALADAGPDAPLQACKGLSTGYYCAKDGLKNYPGDDKDLVMCDGGTVMLIKHCDGGCIFMPPGTPDVCNECGRKADGMYCGKEFPGWLPENANFLVRCQLGAAPTYTKCTTCTARDGSSSCP